MPNKACSAPLLDSQQFTSSTSLSPAPASSSTGPQRPNLPATPVGRGSIIPEGRIPVLTSIPMTHKEDGSQFSFDDIHSIVQYFRYDTEFKDYWAGPIPRNEFLKFVPINNKIKRPDLQKDFIGLLRGEADNEESFSSEVLKQMGPYLLDGFKLVPINDAKSQTKGDTRSPHFSLCAEGAEPIQANSDGSRLSVAELLVGVRASSLDDPFLDISKASNSSTTAEFLKSGLEYLDETDYETMRIDPRYQRGQLIAYATEVCARQHRQFLFSILICHHNARLIRWDHSGALVSESFDYSSAEGIELIGEFLWRYTHASPAERGWDPTVVMASDEERAAFAGNPGLSEWYEEGYVVKMLVWDPEEEEPQAFLVSRPMISPLSVTGRGTRGYMALDIATGGIVFVKDTWRPSLRGLQPEGWTLKLLHDNAVDNIPVVRCHGDLPNGLGGVQSTTTSAYRDHACGQPRRIITYTHYRLVSQTVGRSLIRALQNSRELLEVTQDAFKALSRAYFKCGIMHRDVSVGNIMVDANGKGYLIDWEMAYYDRRKTGDSAPCRAGTWQCMATALQLLPSTPHRPHHDIESFFWAVLYAAFQWFSPEVDDKDAKGICQELFITGWNWSVLMSSLKYLELDIGVCTKYLGEGTLLRVWADKMRPFCIGWFRSKTEIIPEDAFNQFAEAWDWVLAEENLIVASRHTRKFNEPPTVTSEDEYSTSSYSEISTNSLPLNNSSLPSDETRKTQGLEGAPSVDGGPLERKHSRDLELDDAEYEPSCKRGKC